MGAGGGEAQHDGAAATSSRPLSWKRLLNRSFRPCKEQQMLQRTQDFRTTTTRCLTVAKEEVKENRNREEYLVQGHHLGKVHQVYTLILKYRKMQE